MARPYKFKKDKDSEPEEKSYECKWCDRSITENQYYAQNELCDRCHAEFLEDFGGENDE